MGIQGLNDLRGWWEDIGREGGCWAGPIDCQENYADNILGLPGIFNQYTVNKSMDYYFKNFFPLCSGL